MSDILIYGASGHAKVIIDIVEQAGIHRIVGLVDDTGASDILMGYPVAGDIRTYLEQGIRAGLVAIGDNWNRSRIVAKILDEHREFKFVTVLHPSINKARDVEISDGTVVMAGCSINPCARIGRHCIINTGANIDHDCKIDDYASIAPGVTLGGNVVVGEYSAVGLGTSVIQKVEIGTNTVIGAGSVVIKNVFSNCIAFGTPCKYIRKREANDSYL